ncbi:hypothetical protein [Croceimicrobium hydrocarbonivorans]|uniref:Uncharacterized protein n=1 Tax=Croceimicrobium hydrocarbonivorans TaxID=2761580 RepID=A0A7H0VFN2_9FLAO|nr:hypothetical protein [Croceimicrobium hydrocarbonivorans]QNR24530.1 hypothetical protein H4K34_01430 [Croceimicrobium hydrocarbonivorans]
MNLALLNRKFQDFDTIACLDTSQYWQEAIRSFAAMVYLDVIEDSLLADALIQRFEQIAQKHFEEGTPIQIYASSMNSFRHAQEASLAKDSEFIYLCFGNSCLGNSLYMREGIRRVNQKVRDLLAEIDCGQGGMGNK